MNCCHNCAELKSEVFKFPEFWRAPCDAAVRWRKEWELRLSSLMFPSSVVCGRGALSLLPQNTTQWSLLVQQVHYIWGAPHLSTVTIALSWAVLFRKPEDLCVFSWILCVFSQKIWVCLAGFRLCTFLSASLQSSPVASWHRAMYHLHCHFSLQGYLFVFFFFFFPGAVLFQYLLFGTLSFLHCMPFDLWSKISWWCVHGFLGSRSFCLANPGFPFPILVVVLV